MSSRRKVGGRTATPAFRPTRSRNESSRTRRLSLEMPFWMEQEVEPQHGRAAIVDARIQLSEGTNSALEVQPAVLDVVASLDGRTRLGDVISTVAGRLRLSAAELSRLERDALGAIRELLELGALGV